MNTVLGSSPAGQASELWIVLDWRLHTILLLNLPLYFLLGRAMFGSFQAFFDAFPYVRSRRPSHTVSYNVHEMLIVQPDYPGKRPWLLLACTLVYLGMSAAEYALVWAFWGPIYVS